MKTRTRFLIVIILGLLLNGCITREKCMERYPPESSVKDSISRSDSVFVIRDTVIIPGETVTVRLNIPCPEVNMEKVFKKNGTTARLIIKDGVATCQAENDSLTHIIEKQNRTIKEYRNRKEKEVQPPIIIKETPWYFWFLLGIACCVSFYLGNRFKIFGK